MAEAADAAISQMTLVDWLDDLTVRFLLNLPPAELSSVPRLCFQVEEAQWFYEDFIRPSNPTLPSLNLRQFLQALFQHCPLLSGFDATQHAAVYEEFLSYKVRVPVRGAILMDEAMEKVLLVRGWKKGASWSFPRGKINKDEKDIDCAIREVYEETGYDIAAEGLVEPNEQQDGQVKAIDIIMREQHMKLFVFRGVPLETYFEPKTRKEISKIQWYNVKDLPGFKKQKGAMSGHGQGEAQASKFYMVAPFLGHLKKWIGQQRRKDQDETAHKRSVSATKTDLQSAMSEEEGDTEQDFTTDSGLDPADQSADELKRLLSIGTPSASEPVHQKQHNMAPPSHGQNLLSMLRGSQPAIATSVLPQTPLEHIDPGFPTKAPETPQPHHPRQPSIEQHFIPQFPYSPQHLQQAQRNLSLPTRGTLGSGGQSNPPQRSTLADLPPHLYGPLHQNRHLSDMNFLGGSREGPQPSSQANVAASSLNSFHQVQTPDYRNERGAAPPSATEQTYFQGPAAPLASPMPAPYALRPSSQNFGPGSQQSYRPLGSEPIVPEASKLPAPKLNAHSMKLLDAFKSTSMAQTKPRDTSTSLQHNGSREQDALLDLFKKPSGGQSAAKHASEETPTLSQPPSPALTDRTIRPLPIDVESPNIPETTRTLSSIAKAKSPRSATPRVTLNESASYVRPHEKEHTSLSPQELNSRHNPGAFLQTATQDDVVAERPNPQRFVCATSQSQRQEADTSNPPLGTSQRPASVQKLRSPKPNAKPKSPAVPVDNAPVLPQFSILQRPGSSAGRGARSPITQSPLRQASPGVAFQPQVLKRPASGENGVVRDHQEPSRSTVNTGDAKKDRLLSLFNKGSLPATSADCQVAGSTAFVPGRQGESQTKDTLLGLFSGGNGNARPVATKATEPPSAPQLQPERNPFSRGQQQPGGTSQQTPQQKLLSLFSKPASSAVSSPGTPISPFTLGSPTDAEPPSINPALRIGNVSSAMNNGNGSGRQTPTSATPTQETRGFLLDYLNGVVEKEGYRGQKQGL